MKKNKKQRLLSAILLLLAAAFLFVSCAGTKEPDAPNSENDTSGGSSDVSADDMVNFLSGGKFDYVVVRGESASDYEIKAAIALRKALMDLSGTDVEITTDWYKPGDEASIPTKEILVGSTTRSETKAVSDTLTDNSYKICFEGEKLVIVGSSAIGTYKAVEELISSGAFAKPANGVFGVSKTLSVSKEYDMTLPHTIISFTTSVSGSLGGSEQDSARLATCLQGLLNRRFPETDMLVHQVLDGEDTFWLDYMMQDGNYFSDYNVLELKSANDFWDFFLPFIKEYGTIAWDPAVPSTANVASTVCGVDGYLPVMYSESDSSLYAKLKTLGVEEKMSLVGKFTGEGIIPDTDIESSGSTKCDAYLWALEKYMDKCSTEVMAYTLDGAGCVPGTTTYEGAESTNAFYNQIYNHDYFVMKKAFCFDLTSNAKERPFDDPDQPRGTDYDTLCKILQAAYDRANGEFTQIVGFPPWWMKYTVFLGRGNIGEVDLEWQFAQLASTYNCALEADCAHPCCMTNASLYCYYPLEDHYENNTPSEYPEFDEKTRYFTIYIGDYDASAWMKSVVRGFWADPVRGTMPLAWGFNPNLSNRIPMVFDYIYKNKSDLDYFITGDSGAGYVNPSALVQNKRVRKLPTSVDTWVNYNKPYLEKFDMDICGFVLNGALKYVDEVFDMYSKITPVGCFANSPNKLTITNGTPMLQMSDYSDAQGALSKMSGNVNFSVFRTIRVSPTRIKEIAEEIESYCSEKDKRHNYKYVGPYELFDLIKQSGQGEKKTID